MRKPNSSEIICVNCGGGSDAPRPSEQANGYHAPPTPTPAAEEDEGLEPAPAPLRERLPRPSAPVDTALVQRPRPDPSQAGPFSRSTAPGARLCLC